MAEAGESNRAEQLRKQLAKSRALKAQGVQFVVEDSSLPGDKVIKAVKGNKTLGQMALMPPSDRTNYKGAREVRIIRVEPDAQRKGIATSLFNEARKLGLNPIHSERLTDDGKAYSRAQGGSRIPGINSRIEARNNVARKQRGQRLGKERAKQIALEKQMAKVQGRTYTEPQARLRPGINFGGTFSKGLGVLGFLPALMQGGQAAQGRLNLMPHDQTIGQMR
jgi:GNAT superfamily N-acetyltransferase